MIEHGLIDEAVPMHLVREAEEFREKIRGSPLAIYLAELPEPPSRFTSREEHIYSKTFLGRSRQWANARRARDDNKTPLLVSQSVSDSRSSAAGGAPLPEAELRQMLGQLKESVQILRWNDSK